MGRKKSVAMATQCLPDQAEFLVVECQRCQERVTVGGFPGLGPGATNNLTPKGEGATSLHALIHSPIHSTHTSRAAPVTWPQGCRNPLSPVAHGVHSVVGRRVYMPTIRRGRVSTGQRRQGCKLRGRLLGEVTLFGPGQGEPCRQREQPGKGREQATSRETGA